MPLCGWSGRPCSCTNFPWKVNGVIPLRCEQSLPWDMYPHRSVSAAGMLRYKKYLEWRNRQESLRKAGKPHETDYVEQK